TDAKTTHPHPPKAEHTTTKYSTLPNMADHRSCYTRSCPDAPPPAQHHRSTPTHHCSTSTAYQPPTSAKTSKAPSNPPARYWSPSHETATHPQHEPDPNHPQTPSSTNAPPQHRDTAPQPEHSPTPSS